MWQRRGRCGCGCSRAAPRRVHPAEAALRAVRGVRGAPAAIQLPGLISSLGVRLGAGSQRAAAAPRSRPRGPSHGWRRIAAAGKGGSGLPSRRDHSLSCSVPRGGRGAMGGADAVVPTLPFGPCRGSGAEEGHSRQGWQPLGPGGAADQRPSLSGPAGPSPLLTRGRARQGPAGGSVIRGWRCCGERLPVSARNWSLTWVPLHWPGR